ncbi:MAG: pyridoxal-dependent decarboxylase [Pseudomonadota bacterium]
MTHSDPIMTDVFVNALHQLRQHIEQARTAQVPATGYRPLGEILDSMELESRIESGGITPESFAEFLQGYLSHSVQLHHPHHIAHQVAVPDAASALASMVNGFLNNPMAIYEMGPVAAAIEFVVVNWMLEAIGWRPQPRRPDAGAEFSAGVLTHGGSLANLTGLLAARARIAPTAWVEGVPDDLVVMVSPVAHYSVARAVSILGIGSNAIRPLECDQWGRVVADRLDAQIDAVRASGKRVMAIIANACATATGLHDPLREIGEVCNANDIWFHVDACHGASALLHAQTRPELDGIELADAVIWDAHKMLQVSALCAAVLFRDHRSFDIAFAQQASYLAYGEDAESYDSLPRAIECTKSPMGVKVYFNLLFQGEDGLGQFVKERYAMAALAYRVISNRARFECPYKPESNILCFRYDGSDELQKRIRDALVKERLAHLTTTELNGRVYLRFTIMNPATDEAAIHSVLDLIEKMAAKLLV